MSSRSTTSDRRPAARLTAALETARGGLRQWRSEQRPIKMPGNDLLSRCQAAVREYALGEYAAPSARQGLTSVFGMGTGGAAARPRGGSPALWSPGNIRQSQSRIHRGKGRERREKSDSARRLRALDSARRTRRARRHAQSPPYFANSEVGGKIWSSLTVN